MSSKSGFAPARQALTATEIEARLPHLNHWTLVNEGAGFVIEKTFHFDNYYQTIAFVNALAFIAHRQDHHPDLAVHYKRCVVRLHTHDVHGLSSADFDYASRVDALLS